MVKCYIMFKIKTKHSHYMFFKSNMKTWKCPKKLKTQEILIVPRSIKILFLPFHVVADPCRPPTAQCPSLATVGPCRRADHMWLADPCRPAGYKAGHWSQLDLFHFPAPVETAAVVPAP